MIFDSLIKHGYSEILIIIQLTQFYIMLINKYESINSKDYFYFNKIIKSRTKIYLKHYNKKEIKNIIVKLKEIDICLKTSTIKKKNMFNSFYFGICKGLYA